MRVYSVGETKFCNRSVPYQTNSIYSPSVKPSSNVRKITFTGAGLNINQILSISPENNGMGLAEYMQGGEGCVGEEMPASMVKHEGKDVRSIMPFCSYNNGKGGYKFLLHPESEFGVGALPDEIPQMWFYSANPGETLEQVAKKHHLKPSEISYVIQSRPNGNGAEAKSKYVILEPTSAKGEIRRLSDETLGEIKVVPYEIMKISENNPKYVRLKSTPNYVMFTPDLAKTAKPYSYDAWGNGPFEAEIITSDEMRAIADTLQKEKMNTEEFGFYKPASLIAHDRHGHSIANHIANLSAKGEITLNGVKIHIIEHNPGFNYQGRTDDPFKYLRIVADESDLEVLKKMPEFEILQKAQKYGINNLDVLTPREHEIAWQILEPALRPFRDAFGCYNVIKSGIAAVRQNPEHVSLGTVSLNFDKEMKSQETPDAAKSLTDDFASIETKSVVNGSTPANLKLHDPEANFGRGNNGLSANKAGFTTFQYNGSNIEEVIQAREKNAKWFTNLIYEAYQKGPEELNKVFFNDAQLLEKQKVLGYLKPMQDGDMLVMGWGRPDEQKGYNITLGGFKKFLERKDIPLEKKLKMRLAVGAGKWNEGARDYQSIVRLIKEIEELDGGIYKGLVMYVDGFFPNRLVGCAQFGMFTSRREMCGITPLECKAAGVPYGATATGGPVDYTNKLNGYLTQEAVEGRPERYGLTWANSADEIDDARCARQMDQVADIFEQMSEEYSTNKTSYVAKCKKNIEELIDWHENSEYNLGKSANKRYLEDILETDKPFEARNQKPWKRLIGKFGEFKENGEEIFQMSAKTKPMKIILAIAGGVAVLSGAYLVYKNKHNKNLNKVA
ncbi:glycosyltransferase [bacterium]|nr:glycosyltransferase [bacterium]